MGDISEFLTARLDEDEAVARQDEIPDGPDNHEWEAYIAAGERRDQQPHGRQCGWRLGEGISTECECDYPARVLADIAAKRAIVAEFVREDAANFGDQFLDGVCSGLERAVRLLASLYESHKDYDPAWRVG